jgi:hypothetical protein
MLSTFSFLALGDWQIGHVEIFRNFDRGKIPKKKKNMRI